MDPADMCLEDTLMKTSQNLAATLFACLLLLPAPSTAQTCESLGATAQQLYADWMHGDSYLRAARYGQKVTVRAAWGRDVGSTAEAKSLVGNAEHRYPETLDRLLDLRCVDHVPPSVAGNWSNKILLAMVDKGTLTWDKWATWEWKNFLKP